LGGCLRALHLPWQRQPIARATGSVWSLGNSPGFDFKVYLEFLQRAAMCLGNSIASINILHYNTLFLLSDYFSRAP
jgi:hypothetical protein